MQVAPTSGGIGPLVPGGSLPATKLAEEVVQAVPQGDPVDHERGLLDGVNLEEPLEVVPRVSANVVSWFTGTYDERHGTAATRTALAGERIVKAVMTHMGKGASFLARSASVIGKAMPVVNIGMGVAQASRGWEDVEQAEGPLAERMMASKDVRGGVLQCVAGAALLVTGPVGWATSAGLMLAAAANDLDMFSFLDPDKDSADGPPEPLPGLPADPA